MKIRFYLLLFIFISIEISADEELKKRFQESLSRLSSDFEITDVKATPIKGVYQVTIGPDIVYMTKDGNYVLKGEILDISNRRNITEDVRAENRVHLLNTISENASTVGSLDLGIYKTKDGSNEVLTDFEKHKYEIVYLLGQDSLKFKKQNEFIIYQGSHGDKGAEIADVILPGSAYTEQNGYFTNLEGKLQKAFKASYPPGEAKEDWQIINELSEIINNKKIFNDKAELDSSMLNYLNLFKE